MSSGVHAASINQGWEGQWSQLATGKRKGLQFRGAEHSQYIYIYIFIYWDLYIYILYILYIYTLYIYIHYIYTIYILYTIYIYYILYIYILYIYYIWPYNMLYFIDCLIARSTICYLLSAQKNTNTKKKMLWRAVSPPPIPK